MGNEMETDQVPGVGPLPMGEPKDCLNDEKSHSNAAEVCWYLLGYWQ